MRPGARRRLPRRRTGAALAAALLGSAALLSSLTGPVLAEPLELRTRVITRFGGTAEEDGRLDFRGGLVLSGPRGFGGWSGLLVEGERFLAVSDTGAWLKGRLLLTDGRLSGVADARMDPRVDIHGRPITGKTAGDAETLARAEGGVLVGVEMTQQILFYPADGIDVDVTAPATRRDLSTEAIVQLRHYGFEALAARGDGSLIAIAEGGERRADTLPAFHLRQPGGQERRFAVKRDADWSVTGADMLPGGDMVLVERRYGGGIDVGMRVRRIGADAVDRATGVVDGPVLIEAGFSSEIDNMEAIAASVEDDGRLVFTLMSDDNHAFLQRTLMLRFALRDPLPRPKPLPGEARASRQARSQSG
ncbi:hypothetical protein ATO13_15714 [Stappia sp. 22II-S9-Z10]|nr:hypothetical protein ATO13_15714 [Stappia sp. 22II-S9-Z10]